MEKNNKYIEEVVIGIKEEEWMQASRWHVHQEPGPEANEASACTSCCSNFVLVQ